MKSFNSLGVACLVFAAFCAVLALWLPDEHTGSSADKDRGSHVMSALAAAGRAEDALVEQNYGAALEEIRATETSLRPLLSAESP